MSRAYVWQRSPRYRTEMIVPGDLFDDGVRVHVVHGNDIMVNEAVRWTMYCRKAGFDSGWVEDVPGPAVVTCLGCLAARWAP